MSTLSDRVIANCEARTDEDLFEAYEDPKDAPSVSTIVILPDATVNTIIQKIRNGKSDRRIKHTTTTPAGKAPSLSQIREIRSAWESVVATRKAASEA